MFHVKHTTKRRVSHEKDHEIHGEAVIATKRSYADPATAYADRVYDRVIAKGKRSTVATTEAGERYRAFPDGRGVTFVAGKRVVTLATLADVSRLVALLRSGDAPGTPDQRETLAALLATVGGLS